MNTLTVAPRLDRTVGMGLNGPICVPYAISALTGVDLRDEMRMAIAGRGLYAPVIHSLIARVPSLVAVHEVDIDRKLKLMDALPLSGRGLAWVWEMGARGRRNGRSTHMLAYDGKLVLDQNDRRLRWVYDDENWRHAHVLATYIAREVR